MNDLKIVADYKRLTQQRGSLRTVVICIVALLALAGGIAFRAMQPLTLTTIQGPVIHWQDDNWTVVNYFAEWCVPCLREIPELNRYADQHNVRVLGVSFDELDDASLAALIKRQKIRFPVIAPVSSAELPVSMPVVLPTTYIVSPAGDVVKTLRGEVNAARLDAAIAQSKSELL